jgi:hypothetical protein
MTSINQTIGINDNMIQQMCHAMSISMCHAMSEPMCHAMPTYFPHQPRDGRGSITDDQGSMKILNKLVAKEIHQWLIVDDRRSTIFVGKFWFAKKNDRWSMIKFQVNQ